MPDSCEEPSRKVLRVDIRLVKPSSATEPCDLKDVERVKQSIAKHGQVQPILVRRLTDGNFEIVCGHHRHRAAVELGLLEVMIIVLEGDLSATQLLLISLIDNLARRRVKPSELFAAIVSLLQMNDWTLEELAEQLGLSEATVSRLVCSFTKLPDWIKKAIDDEMIPESSGYHLSRLEHFPKEQEEIARLIMAKKIKRDQVAIRVSKILGKKPRDDDDGEMNFGAIVIRINPKTPAAAKAILAAALEAGVKAFRAKAFAMDAFYEAVSDYLHRHPLPQAA